MTTGRTDAKWARALFTAVQFLSRLPVPGGNARDPAASFGEDIQRGLVFFPLIGAMLGALTAVVLVLASMVFPFPLAVLIALTFDMLITGAFHEDAVADFCDAFGGGWAREDILEILKDSRIGSFGTAGLIMALALRAGGLMAIGGPLTAGAALIVAGALGRQVILIVLSLVKPLAARPGLAQQIGRAVPWSKTAIAALLATPIWLIGIAGHPTAMAAAAVTILLFVVWFRALVLKRLGGVTGDCLGFAAYAGIVITTLAFAL